MLIFLLQCGLGGAGRVARGGEFIPLEGFVLVRILDDTIQTHWDLVVSVIRTSSFDHWAERKLSNASLTRQHVMIRMDDKLLFNFMLKTCASIVRIFFYELHSSNFCPPGLKYNSEKNEETYAGDFICKNTLMSFQMYQKAVKSIAVHSITREINGV